MKQGRNLIALLVGVVPEACAFVAAVGEGRIRIVARFVLLVSVIIIIKKIFVDVSSLFGEDEIYFILVVVDVFLGDGIDDGGIMFSKIFGAVVMTLDKRNSFSIGLGTFAGI